MACFVSFKVIRFSIILFVLLNLARPAQAWNAEGHMIVAQIAWNHLNPVARARCNSLIAVPLTNSSAGTSNFVTAAVWGDDFKSALGTSSWHFIDLPFSLDGTPTNGVGAASFDVVRAIRTNILILQNPAATLSNQAIHLRYLLHFVGDIEQPLHCSTAVSASSPGGDAGGNGFSITGDWSNLHSLWDAGGGFLTDSISRPLTATGQNILNAKVAVIEADYPYDYAANVGTIPDPMNWAREGWSLAQTVCYAGLTEGDTPSAGYLDTAMATAEQRMAAGGHRLADLLNTLYPAVPITITATTITNGAIRFSWNTITGGVYRVQWKGSLAAPAWTDATNLTASASSASFSQPLTATQRLYRVVQ